MNASLSLYTVNRNGNYVYQMYSQSSVFKMWYDNIDDVERAGVHVYVCWMTQLVYMMGTNHASICLLMEFFYLLKLSVVTNCKRFFQ